MIRTCVRWNAVRSVADTTEAKTLPPSRHPDTRHPEHSARPLLGLAQVSCSESRAVESRNISHVQRSTLLLAQRGRTIHDNSCASYFCGLDLVKKFDVEDHVPAGISTLCRCRVLVIHSSFLGPLQELSDSTKNRWDPSHVSTKSDVLTFFEAKQHSGRCCRTRQGSRFGRFLSTIWR